MNRLQWITLLLALLNLVLVCLFPPFDYLSQSRSNVPTFDGFAWAFSERPNYIVNSSFLQLELFVVLLNGAIGWLLLTIGVIVGGVWTAQARAIARDRKKRRPRRGGSPPSSTNSSGSACRPGPVRPRARPV